MKKEYETWWNMTAGLYYSLSDCAPSGTLASVGSATQFKDLWEDFLVIKK